ncbi:MAG: hypothetical protein HPY50_00400 [Firmicutes bacterium]|nr:hypothetical protein [Bacillota bacterium]
MRAIMQPEIKDAAIRTGLNILKLGALAGAAVFSNQMFKTMALSAIEHARTDFLTVRDLVRG